MAMSAVRDFFWSPKGMALIVFLAGALLPLAFAPIDMYVLAVLSPATLFYFWRDATPKEAMLQGYLFGLGMFGVGASWIFVSISEFGNTVMPVSVVLTLLFVAGMALFILFTGYVQAKFKVPPTLKLLLVIPAVWTLGEWLRGWFLTGFPWLNLGDSQVDTPLAGFLPVTGSYGVSWLLAVLAALLVLMILNLKRWPVTLIGFVLVFVAGTGLQQIDWVQADGKPLKVSLVQGNISQHDKWKKSQRQPTLDMYRALTRQHWDSDIVVWPETAIPVFYHMAQDNFLLSMSEEARATSTTIISGIPVADRETRQYYNSMVTMGENSQLYHKRHLVPFGEYVPLESLLRGLIGFFNLPMSAFSAGDMDQSLLNAAGHKVAASVCYEIAYSSLVRSGLPEASLLVNVSNDAWFGNSLAPYQHLQLVRVRAMETGRPVLRATNTGITALIDQRGRVQQQLPRQVRSVLSYIVQPMTGSTPFVRFGTQAMVIFMMVLLLIGLLFPVQKEDSQ